MGRVLRGGAGLGHSEDKKISGMKKVERTESLWNKLIFAQGYECLAAVFFLSSKTKTKKRTKVVKSTDILCTWSRPWSSQWRWLTRPLVVLCTELAFHPSGRPGARWRWQQQHSRPGCTPSLWNTNAPLNEAFNLAVNNKPLYNNNNIICVLHGDDSQ